MEKEKIRTRIKIQDLPRDRKVSQEEIRNIKGGVISSSFKLPQPGEPAPPTRPWPWPGPVYY